MLIKKASSINYLLVVIGLIFSCLFYGNVFLLISFVVAFIVFCFFRKRIVEIILLIFLLAIYFLVMYLFVISPANDNYILNTDVVVKGHIISLIDEKDGEAKFILKTSSGEKILVSVKDSPKNIFSPGQQLILNGQFKEIYSPTVPNVFDYKKHLAYEKIHISLSVTDFEIKGDKKFTITMLQFNIEKYIKNNFSKRSASYLIAILVGNKDNLSADTYDNFSNLGILHLFTVSGLHINLILLYLGAILNFFRVKK